MTKRIEELFGLSPKNQKPPEPAPVNEQIVEHATKVKSANDTYKAISTIAKELPTIRELSDIGDKELDDLAAKAEKAYDDLMDLGMNVEVRYSGRIFEVAGTMLGHAITAKSNKVEKKLKAIDLQLKKYKIDKDAEEPEEGNLLNGEGYVITDRNALLKKLGQKG